MSKNEHSYSLFKVVDYICPIVWRLIGINTLFFQIALLVYDGMGIHVGDSRFFILMYFPLWILFEIMKFKSFKINLWFIDTRIIVLICQMFTFLLCSVFCMIINTYNQGDDGGMCVLLFSFFVVLFIICHILWTFLFFIKDKK